MNWKRAGKILACLVLVAITLFVGFIVVLLTSLQGGGRFYTSLAMVVPGALVIFIIWAFFLPVKRRLFILSLSAFLSLTVLAIAGYEINQAYHNQFPKVSEQDVDLREYMPFQEGTRAARLDEPATLRIQSDLPRIDGATALYPLYAAFVQAVYPQKEYELYDSEVMANKTPQAYDNLIEGRVDLIFAYGPSEQQMAHAKQHGVELKLTPIGRDAFVFFVNASNPVRGLTTQQIKDIYSGFITNWEEVGGEDEPIRAFQRPANSGSQTMLEQIMGGQKLMTPPQEDVVQGMGQIIEQTADYRNYPNAIGYTFLFFANDMVKNGNIRLLEIDGVKPERSTIESKQYPFATEFYAVTAGSDNPHVARFIEWILSPQGQALVERTGYTPISP